MPKLLRMLLLSLTLIASASMLTGCGDDASNDPAAQDIPDMDHVPPPDP